LIRAAQINKPLIQHLSGKSVTFVVNLMSRLPMLQNWIKDLVERHAFGVCQYLGEKMRVAPAEVRIYFIYTSFIAMGSPLILYLMVAFWVNLRRYIRRGRSVLWE